MSTTEIIWLVVSAVAGYLLGSINTSLLVGKLYGVDIREHGSGNAGATNTLRTLGKKAALLVGLGDVGKGIAACLIGLVLTGNETGVLAGGLLAIVGHNWPLYFGFRGGKGIFTTFAVILFADWQAALILVAIFLLLVAWKRYVSLGSIVGTAMFPVVELALGRSLGAIVVGTVIAVMAVWRHRGNIERLMKGTERKLSFGKKEEKNA